MRVIIRGSWAKYVGTDYCEALGNYADIAEAEADGRDYAWNNWEDDADDYDEDGEYCGEGPDYYLEEYNPDKHDGHRSGGGSFEDDFERLERDY